GQDGRRPPSSRRRGSVRQRWPGRRPRRGRSKGSRRGGRHAETLRPGKTCQIAPWGRQRRGWGRDEGGQSRRGVGRSGKRSRHRRIQTTNPGTGRLRYPAGTGFDRLVRLLVGLWSDLKEDLTKGQLRSRNLTKPAT